ncbi:hypothetical protein [Streptomyces sp. Tu 3180]|uniref:hypothetical protein n=1 Tax=Streptomyces sp. Tu 3180 TaxID=2682611 RepID=UPI001358AED7|nr:hypothetical protein [Streptomyces sp. Tu 3180]KAF3469179.1 hypothetical protein GL259_36130 [Streptomyces sp. Tu 3180]
MLITTRITVELPSSDGTRGRRAVSPARGTAAVGGVRPDRPAGRRRVRHGPVVTAVVIPAPTSERAG